MILNQQQILREAARSLPFLSNTQKQYLYKIITFGKEFGVKFGVKFGDNEKQLILAINSNPGLTAQELADSIGITKRAVEKQIKKLRELNVLTHQGSAKNGLWVINRNAME